ncbi:hypothetical protein X777_14044 [Ooceraea biroi]|uniref:Uncharacterized protein n=1 Tax=Ooceraea biroi TaxID=2015173 RepID=A0A026VZ85_OOCBI|nr:hypothetical protein X777_14044 [Ooceraea biroi]
MSEIGRNGTRGNESDCVYAFQRVHFRFARGKGRKARAQDSGEVREKEEVLRGAICE